MPMSPSVLAHLSSVNHSMMQQNQQRLAQAKAASPANPSKMIWLILPGMSTFQPIRTWQRDPTESKSRLYLVHSLICRIQSVAPQHLIRSQHQLALAHT